MVARFRGRDPFWDDGVGARRTRLRVKVEAFFAFAIAIVACGLTLAMWILQIAPFWDQISPL